jgi:hypothetical protein
MLPSWGWALIVGVATGAGLLVVRSLFVGRVWAG